MTKQNQIYKCNYCKNIVEVLHSGVGELVCCGKPMELLEEKDKDKGLEKHVPVIKELSDNSGVKIKVGEIDHPMENDHYIEWIELAGADNTHLKFLKPGDKPEASFKTTDEKVSSREFCSVHGLWQS
ncbi:hypothetical protein LCGC14_2034950 [marine sediment metagenome]|uniref:Desulfoferrodoxin ferrous iron-binding domain-containing protein n=1 Tax=marine sediment metagenome TaxID=412755 RepID=A0A0F9H716_9ZZZZ